MLKLKKIIFISAIALILAFTLQKTTNFYIERQINTHLNHYEISARLEKLNKLTLKYKSFSITCKIKLEKAGIYLIPENGSIFSKLLPDKIRINYF